MEGFRFRVEVRVTGSGQGQGYWLVLGYSVRLGLRPENVIHHVRVSLLAMTRIRISAGMSRVTDGIPEVNLSCRFF